MSPKQTAILRHIEDNGSITKAQAVALIGGDIYHNAGHYVGQILSRMVKRGIISRKSRGIYVLGGEPAPIIPRTKCSQEDLEPTPVYLCKYETGNKGRTSPCVVCPKNR